MKCTLLGILALAACSQVQCMEADLALHQLNHKSWTVAEGAPGAIYAITQTTDGTLWLAGPSGLSRFDGIHFARYEGNLGAPAQTDITSLAADKHGSLWLGFVLGGVSVLKSHGIVHYDERNGLPRGTVNNIVIDTQGAVFAATGRGLYQLLDDRAELVSLGGDRDSVTRIWAARVDRAGTLWIVTDTHLLARRVGESQFTPMAPRNNSRRVSPNALASGPSGQMWVLNLSEMGTIARVGAPLAQIRHGDTSTNPGVAVDHRGNLWVGGEVVRRFPAAALAGDLRSAVDAGESFTLGDGLTGGSVTCFFEDREGNMWVGTYSGLDRFSYSNVMRVDATNTFGAAVAAEGGTVWVSAVSTDAGPRYPLLEIRDSKILSAQKAPHFTSAHRAWDGTLWFGGRSGVSKLQSGQLSARTPLPAVESVQAMVQDRSGALWVSITRNGLFRLTQNGWATEPGQPPLAAAMDSQGRLLFGYRADQIARVDGSAFTHFGAGEGLKVGNVTAIASQREHVWIGGDRGLAHFDGARFSPVLSASGNPFTGLSGVVATANGDLWVNGNVGIAHVTRAELERAVRDPTYRVSTEVFDRLDGLRGYARQVRPSPSAFEGTDGSLWFATQVGLVGIDPSHIVRNTLPPPITIWSINGRHLQFPAVERADFPIHTTSVRIDYSAASLTIPERVRFRYRLDGVDEEWQDAGDRREATYTNLSPGNYSFRVIASNNDGVWNTVGAAAAFHIAPAFYQTSWFYGLCVLVGIAVLWLLYLVRIRQVSAQLRGRLEERLAERERIARELHDTLLQSVQGLVLRFRAAVSRLPREEPARSALETALERADGVLAEGRDRVKELRVSPGGDLDISLALAAWAEELATEQSGHFRSTIEGTPRRLHPIVSEEALYIAREALTNAFRHAGARQIEAEISYGTSELQIRIRDDGRGIDETVLREGGRAGHWGVLGMRERAKKIRATLTIWSKAGAGTEVDLRLPAHVAYLSGKRISRRESLASWLS